MKLTSVIAPCLVLLLCGTAQISLGQPQGDPAIEQAADLCRSGNLNQALRAVDRAIATQGQASGYAWFVKAFIHKEMFVQMDELQTDSQHRVAAVEAIKRSAAIGRAGSTILDPDLEVQLDPLLAYLAQTYLMDAQRSASEVKPGEEPRALRLFERYVQAEAILNPGFRDRDTEVLLLQNLAEHALVASRPEANPLGGDDEFELGVELYIRAAKAGPDAFTSWYNAAVHTYNRGVHLYRHGPDYDLDAEDRWHAVAASLWDRSRNLMWRAVDLREEDPDVLHALSTVAEALDHKADAAWCREHLHELQRN
jgi:tetratricopeptide (TPR) repeat protein